MQVRKHEAVNLMRITFRSGGKEGQCMDVYYVYDIQVRMRAVIRRCVNQVISG